MPLAEREAVAHPKTKHRMSERWACQLLQCCRMTVRYASVRVDDTKLLDRMKAIAHERRRLGCRRICIMLKRDGTLVNHKRLFRLYCEEKLSVRKRGGRKRALGTRAPMLLPLLPKQGWSLDLVSDQSTDCRRFRVINVIDACTVCASNWRQTLTFLADA
jgi:putative transposase